MTTLKTAEFCKAHKFTKCQALSFEILCLIESGMTARAAMFQVCGPATEQLPPDSTDAQIFQAVKDNFTESFTPEQVQSLALL